MCNLKKCVVGRRRISWTAQRLGSLSSLFGITFQLIPNLVSTEKEVVRRIKPGGRKHSPESWQLKQIAGVKNFVLDYPLVNVSRIY
jgi:hypothetical protein